MPRSVKGMRSIQSTTNSMSLPRGRHTFSSIPARAADRHCTRQTSGCRSVKPVDLFTQIWHQGSIVGRIIVSLNFRTAGPLILQPLQPLTAAVAKAQAPRLLRQHSVEFAFLAGNGIGKRLAGCGNVRIHRNGPQRMRQRTDIKSARGGNLADLQLYKWILDFRGLGGKQRHFACARKLLSQQQNRSGGRACRARLPASGGWRQRLPVLRTA